MLKRKGKIYTCVEGDIHGSLPSIKLMLVQEIEKATEMNLMQASNLNIHQPIGYY